MDEEKLRFQIYANQLKQISEHISEMELHKTQLEAAKEGLSEIKKAKKGTRILAPLSQGIYIEASVQDTKNVMVNSGAGVATKKDIDTTIDELEKELKKITDYISGLSGQRSQLSSALANMQHTIKQNTE